MKHPHYEWCPYCDTEVILLNAKEKTRQRCPQCNNTIMPCGLCTEETRACYKCHTDNKQIGLLHQLI